jgi:4-amino-4-deoxy-L-arabinose transferase-like glycosyltransferase
MKPLRRPPKIKERSAVTAHQKRWVFLFSLMVHLIIAIFFINLPIALDDMFQYDMLARSIVNGRGYRWYTPEDVEKLKPYLERFLPIEEIYFPEDGLQTAHRPPGYPFFLAALYTINAGSSRFALVRVVQAIIFASLSLLVLKLGEIIGLSNREAVISGLIISLYPILLFYPIGLASENVFIPLYTIALILAWKINQNPSSIGLHALLGLVFGGLVLTRGISVLILIVIFLWIVFSINRSRWLILVSISISLLIFVPWAVRNSQVMGRPAFVENSLWFNMYIGYHPEGNGNFVSDIAIKPLFLTDTAERESFCREETLAFIRNDPGEALKRMVFRIPAFFGPETREFNYFYSNNLVGEIPQPWISMIFLLLTLPWFLISLFGTIGLFFNQNRAFAILCGLAALFYFLPHLPILTEPRFHLTLVPTLIPFSVHGFTTMTHLKNNSTQLSRKEKMILGLIIVGFIAMWAFEIFRDFPLYLQLLSPGGNQIGLSY